MEKTHHGQHDVGCFGCKLQTIQISPYATPNRLHPSIPPRRPEPAWERGIPTDSRGMPFLKKDGTPMGQKEFSVNRRSIEEHRRKLHNSTSAVQPTGS